MDKMGTSARAGNRGVPVCASHRALSVSVHTRASLPLRVSYVFQISNISSQATPRDGAPIEISALLYATVRWLADASAKGRFAHAGVAVTSSSTSPTSSSFWTWAEWAARIERSFDRTYYVPRDAGDDGKYACNTVLVNRCVRLCFCVCACQTCVCVDVRSLGAHRRGIWRDVVGASDEWTCYQVLQCA
jgi:hypothetical protein